MGIQDNFVQGDMIKKKNSIILTGKQVYLLLLNSVVHGYSAYILDISHCVLAYIIY